MEEVEFDYCWNWSAPLATPPEAADGGSSLPPPPPPPLSGDGCAGSSNSPRPAAASPPLIIITADRSWSLDDLSVTGDDDIVTTGTNGSLALETADWSMFAPQGGIGGGGAGEESHDPLLGFDTLESLLGLDGSSSGSGGGGGGANQEPVDPQAQLHADHPWGVDSLLPIAPPTVPSASLPEQTLVGAGGSPPAAPATGQNQAGVGEMSPVLPEDEVADVTMTLADMIRIAEECGQDDAASRVWSDEEHRDLLYGLRRYVLLVVVKFKSVSRFSYMYQCNRKLAVALLLWSFHLIIPTVPLPESSILARYAKHDPAHACFNISTYLAKKTALDVALRCRWLQVIDFIRFVPT
jgi:hypothetical protein